MERSNLKSNKKEKTILHKELRACKEEIDIGGRKCAGWAKFDVFVRVFLFPKLEGKS